jgi:hypothetical protein
MNIPKVFKSVASTSIVLVLLSAWPQVSLGAGPTEPVGPQGTVGATQTQVGPQGTVGVTSPTGPQVVVGPTEPTGHQDVVVAPAAASGSVTQSNDKTGANSDNSNAATTSSTTKVGTDNTATIKNDVTAGVNTGSNTVNQNTSVGQVSTGDINATVNIVNVANSTFAPGSSVGSSTVNGGDASQISLSTPSQRGSLPSSTTQTNSSTGANSANQNGSSDSNYVQVVGNNTATANNSVAIDANTGNNQVGQNTAVGGVQTGNVNLAVTEVNVLNVTNPNLLLGMDIYSVSTANPDSVIIVPSNSTTGDNSSNSNNSTVNNDTSVQVTQNADVSNDISVSANTGNNTVDHNSSTGAVSSGSTTVDANAVNLENVSGNEFYIVNVFGDWNGILQGVPAGNYVINHMDNSNTGANSDNSNSSDQNNSSTYSLNNTATTNNKIDINANTGGNQITSNSKVGDIKTGNISVYANVINALNVFSHRTGHFTLGILNIFSMPHGSTQQAPQTQTVVAAQPADSQAPVGISVNSQGVVSVPAATQTVPTTVQPNSTPSVSTSSYYGVGGGYPSDGYGYAQTAGTGTTTTRAVVSLASAQPASRSLMQPAAGSQVIDPTPAASSSSSSALPLLAIPTGLSALWLGLETATVRNRRRSK